MNERARAENILELVEAELMQNLTELETIVDTRDEALESYISAIGVFNETGSFPADFREPELPQITSVAYQLATQSGAILRVDPENLLVIAQAYEALNTVQANAEFLDNRNAQIRFQDGEQYLSGFIYFTNRAIRDEPAAVEAVQSAIDVL
ncbi:MAG: hypothetical protein AAFR74_05485 [Pseudomonadota bacterium]